MMPRVPPAGLALLAFGAQLAVTARRGPSAASAVLATGVGLGSMGLLLGSLAEFGRRGTTVDPVRPGASALVTTGPHRLTRNPMYVGMAGMLTAHAIAVRSPRALVPAALFVVVIDRWQIPAEESVLRDRFGDAYETYASKTSRWLGPAGARSGRQGGSLVQLEQRSAFLNLTGSLSSTRILDWARC